MLRWHAYGAELSSAMQSKRPKSAPIVQLNFLPKIIAYNFYLEMKKKTFVLILYFNFSLETLLYSHEFFFSSKLHQSVSIYRLTNFIVWRVSIRWNDVHKFDVIRTSLRHFLLLFWNFFFQIRIISPVELSCKVNLLLYLVFFLKMQLK